MERRSLKAVIEANIPFIKGLIDDEVAVGYLAPEAITAEAMREADLLITRTRTRCDAALLDGSRCRMIATATIGTDHIDLDYCRRRGIEVANAPGCNAPAVAQYVFASLLALYPEGLEGKTIGIVGVGHVGKIVADWGRQLGMTVLQNDPPRALVEGAEEFVGLDEIAEKADVITYHTPMVRDGEFPTYHLFDQEFADKLRRRPTIINAARGPITDTEALIRAREQGQISNLVIDCWENEPRFSPRLLELAAVATPHVAGYSRQGKIRATRMAVEAVARRFNLSPKPMAETAPEGAAKHVNALAIAQSYNPLEDTAALKTASDDFERLRNRYKLREEVPNA